MAGPQNKQAWLRDRATRLSGRMAQRGMTLSVDAAETFLARTLDTAAALTDNTALATAFTRDSTTARATANTTPPPPRLHSVD